MSVDPVFTLYRFFDANGHLLYVGMTSNPSQRIRAHQTEKSWWSQVVNITLEYFADRAALSEAERTAIASERPRHNVVIGGGAASERSSRAIRGKTFSLAEVAEQVLPAEWVDAERWLARRLNRGQIRGYRVGRVWRMTEDQVADLVERFTNNVIAAPVEGEQRPAMGLVDGLTERGRRRVRNAS